MRRNETFLFVDGFSFSANMAYFMDNLISILIIPNWVYNQRAVFEKMWLHARVFFKISSTIHIHFNGDCIHDVNTWKWTQLRKINAKVILLKINKLLKQKERKRCLKFSGFSIVDLATFPLATYFMVKTNIHYSERFKKKFHA